MSDRGMFDRLSRGHVPIEDVKNPKASPIEAKMSRTRLRDRVAHLPGRKPVPNIKPMPKRLVYDVPSVERARGDDPRTYPEYRREYTPGPYHGLRRREAIASQFDYFDRLRRYNEQMEYARRDLPPREAESFGELLRLGDIRGFEGLGRPVWDQHLENMLSYGK